MHCTEYKGFIMKTTINLSNGSQIEVEYEHVHTLNVYTIPEQEEVLAKYYDEVEEAIVQQELSIHCYGGKTTLPVDKLLQYQPYSGRWHPAIEIHTQDSLAFRRELAEQLTQMLDTSRDIVKPKFKAPEGYVAQDCNNSVKRVYRKLGRPSHIKS